MSHEVSQVGDILAYLGTIIAIVGLAIRVGYHDKQFREIQDRIQRLEDDEG